MQRQNVITEETKAFIQLVIMTNVPQEEFAKLTDTSQVQVSRWVTGVRSIKPSTLDKVANKLGYTIEKSFKIVKNT